MKKNNLAWIFEKTKGGKYLLLILGLSSVSIAITNVAFAFIMKLFIDKVTEKLQYSWFILFSMSVLILLFEGVITILTTYCSNKVQAITEKNVREELF